MSNARNIAALSTVEVGATADQTKADIEGLGIAASSVTGALPADIATAKAWVKFNMATLVISGSHNISSIQDNGTGRQRPLFTNAMSNSEYSAVANGTSVANWNGSETTVISVTTAGFEIYHVEGSVTYDATLVTGIAFGA